MQPRQIAHSILLLILSAGLIKFVTIKYINSNGKDDQNYPFLYLTNWTVFLHILYYSSTTVFSNFKFVTENLQNLLWRTAYPLGCFVPIIFWTVFNIDREAIYPASNDEIFSKYDNHVLHTLTAIIYILTILCSPVPKTKSEERSLLRELKPSYIFVFIYYNSMCLFYKFTGRWPYGFFAVLWAQPYFLGYFGLAIFAFGGMGLPIAVAKGYYRVMRGLKGLVLKKNV